MTTILIIRTSNDYVGVRFSSSDEAFDWADKNNLTEAGCVQIVSRREALAEAR